MVGSRPLAVRFVLLFWGWLFVFGGLLVFFSHHLRVFPFPSMMTWALRPHGVRTRGKKTTRFMPAATSTCRSIGAA